MYKKLKELLAEKAIVDSKIRALRVKEVRASIAQAIVSGFTVDTIVLQWLGQLNDRIRAVHYLHSEVDDLLDLIEDKIEESTC